MLDKISMFGKGFVGGWVYYQNPENYIVHSRGMLTPTTNKILWLISTVHNYNVFTDPLLDINTNLVELVKELSYAKEKFGSDFEFNFISSWFVYGNTPDLPAKEDSICDPQGFYSITKRSAEQLLISYCTTFGINWRILRLGNVMGVGDNKISKQKNAVQFMLRELVQGREISLYKGQFLRDVIDVRDAAHAIELVMEKGNPNEIYNVGNGTPYNVSDIIGYVYALRGGKVKMIDPPQFHKQVQSKNDMYLDVTKLQNLGYEPQHRLSETLDWLIDYYSHEQTANT